MFSAGSILMTSAMPLLSSRLGGLFSRRGGKAANAPAVDVLVTTTDGRHRGSGSEVAADSNRRERSLSAVILIDRRDILKNRCH